MSKGATYYLVCSPFISLAPCVCNQMEREEEKGEVRDKGREGEREGEEVG